MAATVLSFLAILLCISSFYTPTLQDRMNCDITNIHFTAENGIQQVFKVKQLKSESLMCNSCSEDASSTTSPASMSISTHPIGYTPYQHHQTRLFPTVTLMLGRDSMSEIVVPIGVCPDSPEAAQNSCSSEPMDVQGQIEALDHYASVMIERGLLPHATGNQDIDHKLAHGILLLNAGHNDAAITKFDGVIKSFPKAVTAHHGRGVAFVRKSLQDTQYLQNALENFNHALAIDPDLVEAYQRRAEINIALGRIGEALKDIDTALLMGESGHLHFLRGTVGFISEDLEQAENDFKKAADVQEGDDQISALYQLGLTKFYRGKIRNANEIFKEILRTKSGHLESQISLCQGYRELGYMRTGNDTFEKMALLHADNPTLFQLKASFDYGRGDTRAVLRDVKHCLELDPIAEQCRYTQSLALVQQGHIFAGVKSITRVMIAPPSMKVSPEFLKSHYLREYARYLHHHLDDRFLQLDPDNDLVPLFKDHWINQLPFSSMMQYKEQPGITPSTEDIHEVQFSSYSKEVQRLLCNASAYGEQMQVGNDGYLPNVRHNLAMGLSSIHIGQVLQNMWKELQNNKNNGRSSTVGWREIFDTAVKYRRLVDPEQPVFWLDKMPAEFLRDGYYTNTIMFMSGYITNIKVATYFDLVFSLMRTMVDRYAKDEMESASSHSHIKEDLDSAKSFGKLLDIIKKRNPHQQDFLVSTQVPGTKDKAARHEGLIFALSSDRHGRPVFSINLATTRTRTATYHIELDYIFSEIVAEVKKNNSTKGGDMDYVINMILSLVYYFHNLMPLSRGSSAVATSVALGLILSIGRDVTGKIAKGKLPEMEAILSGAPDTFHLVCKNYMNIKKVNRRPADLMNVSEAFPTVRSVMEALNLAGRMTC